MKTKFDVYESASAAASTMMDLMPFEMAAATVEVFRAESQAAADWPFWKAAFDERREFFLALRSQPAPSAPPPTPAGTAKG